jgi:hypothetical protein
MTNIDDITIQTFLDLSFIKADSIQRFPKLENIKKLSLCDSKIISFK